MSDFICPYCFNKIDTDYVCFLCGNENCVWPDYKRTAFLNDIPLSQVNEKNVQKKRTVFRASEAGIFKRLFGGKNPVQAYCPTCAEKATVRACPECHSPLPQGVDHLSNMLIAIVGAKETGKSHYIAVLIQQIRKLYKSFGWTLSANNDETITLYRNQFYQPLFNSKPPTTLDPTQTAKSNRNVREPLLYTLSMTNSKEFKTVTLAFFDTAGEDMDKETEMKKINRYIFNASGIILLIDPLQLPKVRETVKADNMPEADNAYVGEIVDRMVNLIQNNRNIPKNQKIPIPLAVVLSKIDMLQGRRMGENLSIFRSPVFQKTRHRGTFDLREFGYISGNIQGWIDELDDRKDIIQKTLKFTETGFFGVSALGTNPRSEDGVLLKPPRPRRVEDPFLWLLWKNGFIEGVNS